MKKVKNNAEAYQLFDLLGIKNVSTERQLKNGTRVYELPIHKFYSPMTKYPLRFATYKSGYIRNVTKGLATPYQINPVRKVKRVVDINRYYLAYKRVLIPTDRERTVFLANFILKNYYKKPTYLISDYTMDTIKSQYEQANIAKVNMSCFNELRNQSDELPWFEYRDPKSTPTDNVQVIINGHRYNLS